MIGFFEEKDRKCTVDLWQRTFNDGRDYINNFIDDFGDSIIVSRNDDVVVGIVCLLDVFLGNHKGGYIYALAVDEKYRNLGIATQLLNFAEKTSISNGFEFLIVVPEPYDSLERFYKKLGYDVELSLCTKTIKVTKHSNTVKAVLVDKEEYRDVRSIQPNTVIHSDKFFEHVYRDLIFEGFEFLKVQHENAYKYCVYKVKEDCVIIKEMLPAANVVDAAYSICDALRAEKAILISSKGKQKFPFALIKKLNCKIVTDLYANLLFDSFGG